MKFKLKQEKLENMLEKLLMKDMFPSCIISIKEEKLFSIQKEEHGRALRFLKFNKLFFDSIEGEGSVKIDCKKMLGLVKNIMPNTDLTVEVKGNKISIAGENVGTGEKIELNVGWKDPEEEIKTSLPFPMEKGVPIIGDSKIRLETYFTMDLPNVKDIAQYGSVLGTEFYKFSFENKKVCVRVGDLHDFSDYALFHPKYRIIELVEEDNKEVEKTVAEFGQKTGDELSVIFTYGMPQVAATFENEVHVKSKTNSPAWIYEGTKEYVHGILIPPFVPDEEDESEKE